MWSVTAAKARGIAAGAQIRRLCGISAGRHGIIPGTVTEPPMVATDVLDDAARRQRKSSSLTELALHACPPRALEAVGPDG